MRIAFFLSSKNIVPPLKTGGVEWFSYFLIRELVKRGHEIKLFAAPGSKIKGVKIKEISPFPTSVKVQHANLQERITSFYDSTSLAEFCRSGEWKNFDLVQYNNYIFYEILPFTKMLDVPVLIQINYSHKLVYPHIKDSLKQFKNVYYLPVSRFSKSIMPDLSYLDPLYPSINVHDFPFSQGGGEYLLFMGRICPEKGAHSAIQIAKRSSKKLVIAGGVSEEHREYFNSNIKPHVDNKNVVYIGEVDFKTRVKIYQKALATLFPIAWDETFGLVLVESMACGTPVIAYDRAAIREIIKDKESGYITKDGDINEMVKAVERISRVDRKKTREHVKRNFSISDCAKKYEMICEKIITNFKK